MPPVSQTASPARARQVSSPPELAPPAAARALSEALLLFPAGRSCFVAPRRAPAPPADSPGAPGAPGTRAALRDALGLPRTAVVVAAPHAGWKLCARLLRAARAALAADPTAVIWLPPLPPAARRRLFTAPPGGAPPLPAARAVEQTRHVQVRSPASSAVPPRYLPPTPPPSLPY
jgi:hypothetical protein